MKKKLDNALLILKRNGIAVTALHVIHRIIVNIYGGMQQYKVLYLYILDTPLPSAKSLESAKHHSFKFATRDELITLQQNPDFGITDTNIKAHSNGDRCLLQLDGEELVGYAWIAASTQVALAWGFQFKMSADTVYNYNGYTSPKYRGLGFQPLRHLKLLELVKSEGKKQLLGFVDQLNLNSQRGVRKSGYFKIGTLKCIRNYKTTRFSLKVGSEFWGEKIKQ